MLQFQTRLGLFEAQGGNDTVGLRLSLPLIGSGPCIACSFRFIVSVESHLSLILKKTPKQCSAVPRGMVCPIKRNDTSTEV